MISLRSLSNCADTILTPKAANIKKLALFGYDIPISYFISHEDILALAKRVHKFQERLKACALSADPAELSKIRDDLKNLKLDKSSLGEFEKILLRHKNNKNWIIRSAYSCEDENQSAFAGNFLSERVQNASALTLAQSLLRVFASFFETDAFLNILSAGSNPLNVKYGVLLQIYIRGQIAGVAFSRDPNELIDFVHNTNVLNGYTEWVRNGCEALTAGKAVSGRCYFNSKHKFSEKFVFLDHLAKAAHKLESLLGAPVDFEWTWDGKTLWWLQARPIVSEECRRVLTIKSGTDLSRDKVAERFPEIITPMGWSLIKNTLSRSLMSFGSYVKIKFTNTDKAAYFYKGLVYANKKYYRLENFTASSELLVLVPVLLIKLFFGRAYKTHLYLCHNFILKSASAKVLKDWNLILEKNLTEIKKFDGKFVDAANCLEKMKVLRELGAEFFKTDIATHFFREAYGNLITKALISLGIGEKEALQACARFSNNITIHMYEDLAKIKNSPNKDTLLENFLDTYGHMTTSWDVAHPTLKENKRALKDLATHNSISKVPGAQLQTLPINYAQNQTLLEALQITQDLARADEQQHFFAGLHVSKARELLLSLADHWKSHNILFEADDIFYLTIDEAELFLKNPECAIKFTARRRKKIWQRYAEFEQHKNISKESYNNIIHGIAASPGCATGTLFIAQNFSDLALMPEDAILYLRTPNPSYVPWFDRCKALLTETGGILSHGFIAARELHVPAVSGIPIDALRHKILVTVDGSKGEVFFH